MTTVAALATQIVAFVSADAGGEEGEAAAAGEKSLPALQKLKACKTTFAKLKKTVAASLDEGDDVDECINHYVRNYFECKAFLAAEAEKPLLRDWRGLQVPDANQVAPLAAASSPGLDSKATEGGGSGLQRLGISIELKSYQGEQGECARWWRALKRTLTTSNIASPDQLFLIVTDRLRGDANTAFWQFFEEAETRKSGSGKDVNVIMPLMIALYDQGQHAQVCMKGCAYPGRRI